MSKNLTEIREALRAALQDTDPDSEIWEDTELDQHALRAKEDIDTIRPRERKTTLATTVGSKVLDISTLEDLIEMVKVEYQVNQDPPDYRNVILWAGECSIDIESTPSVAEPVIAFWTSPHTLTTDESTIPPFLTNVLIAGAEAYASIAWITKGRSQIMDAILKLADSETALDSIAARIAQAVTDISAARGGIALKLTEANTAMAAMATRITQAVADLVSARTYINQLNRGGSPQTNYVQTAEYELAAAGQYLGQARGYLAEDQPAQEKINLASHELSVAGAYISQSRSHLEGARSRLDISSMIASYQKDAMDKLAIYKNMLKENEQIRVAVGYPTD